MSRLSTINAQIERLQKQAEELRTKEAKKTLSEIVQLMQAFGITLQDIKGALSTNSKEANARSTGGSLSKKKITTNSKRIGVKVPPKYKGPNGQLWSGRGVMPRWLAELVKNGHIKEDFSISQELPK